MAEIPISKTKIIPPRRRPELLTRKRLLDSLFAGLDKKLTLISAPAGYGKTSLLIDLAEQVELSTCWLALDELDTKSRRFAAYFIAALSETFPDFGTLSFSTLNGMSSLEDDMERLVVTICNEIYEKIPEHFVFVIDDFHLLNGIQSIQGFIERFITLMYENCHLIISSRKLTDLADLTQLVAYEEVSGLSFSELAFLPNELQALLAQNKNLQISDEKAKELIDKTEGWITGLQFIDADVLPKSTTGHGLKDNKTLFGYFNDQVLGGQTSEMRDFILRTSMFDEFDAELCKSVLADFYPGEQDWQNWVFSIAKNNTFVLPVGRDGRSLRYHHLFRDFIRDYFKHERPQEVITILYTLEAVYEEMGEWEKAHQVCKQLDDNELLVNMIERATPHIYQRVLLTIESWLNDIPLSILRERAGLLSIRGLILETKGQLEDGIKLYNQAEIIQRRDNDIKGLALTLSRRAISHQRFGNYSRSLEDADEVIRLTEFDDSMQLLHAYGLRVKGLTLHGKGEAQASLPFFEKSLEIYSRSKENESIATLLLETGMAYRAVGNYADALSMYLKALVIFKQENSFNSQANVLNNIGVLHHMKGEYDLSIEAFEEGLLCSRVNGLWRPQILILLSFGDLISELEDFAFAEQRYQQTQDSLEEKRDRFLSISLMFSQINLELLRGDINTARDRLQKAVTLIEPNGSKYEKGVLYLGLGRLSLMEGQYKNALEQLNKARDIYMKHFPHTEISAAYHIWHAAAFFQNKEYDKAANYIEKIIGTHKHNVHPVVVACHQARRWLDGILQKADPSKEARDILQKSGRFTTRLPELRRGVRLGLKSVQPPASRLLIRGFGPALVDLGGRQLQIKDWQTHAVRDLFFYFLNLTKPVTKEQIGDELWDDIFEPAKISLRFKNDIYRLRKAVGRDTIMNDGSLYYFNRNIDYEYDVEIFESLIKKAISTKDEDEQIEYYQKAVDKVGGPYLNDIFRDWVVQGRARIDLKYLKALESLAKLYLSHANLDKALQTCQQAISYDVGFEAAYQIAMQVHHRRGDKPNIKLTYITCQRAMKQKFSMPPSPETGKLYHKLME